MTTAFPVFLLIFFSLFPSDFMNLVSSATNILSYQGDQRSYGYGHGYVLLAMGRDGGNGYGYG